MKLNRIIHEFDSIVNADSILLSYLDTKAFDDKVNLHCFLIGGGTENWNLGDYLSHTVVEYMLSLKGYSLDQASNGKKDLYAIGSIILMGHQDCTIWGTGLPFRPSKIRAFFHCPLFRRLDIRAVRGPLTQNVLEKMGHKCPSVYGDPAVLMPQIYHPKAKTKEYSRLIIPHFSREKMVNSLSNSDKILSMKTNDYRYVIDEICKAEKVISSSLHGIILAESYGVPTVFYQDRPDEYNFKYTDWYRSTGRNMKECMTLSDALKSKPQELPDLREMRKNLMQSFPYDLWDCIETRS